MIAEDLEIETSMLRLMESCKVNILSYILFLKCVENSQNVFFFF